MERPEHRDPEAEGDPKAPRLRSMADIALRYGATEALEQIRAIQGAEERLFADPPNQMGCGWDSEGRYYFEEEGF